MESKILERSCVVDTRAPLPGDRGAEVVPRAYVVFKLGLGIARNLGLSSSVVVSASVELGDGLLVLADCGTGDTFRRLVLEVEALVDVVGRPGTGECVSCFLFVPDRLPYVRGL